MNKDPIGKDRLIKLLRQIVDSKSEWESYSIPPELRQKLNELESILIEEPQKTLKAFGVTAQVSIYPLHVTSLSPIINEALLVFNKFGLEVHPGSMSTLISGDNEMLWAALNNAFSAAAVQGEVVMTVTVSNACPLPSDFKA
jgi:uncharacterized protein YqgV (UPF0045/DUF77 family)